MFRLVINMKMIRSRRKKENSKETNCIMAVKFINLTSDLYTPKIYNKNTHRIGPEISFVKVDRSEGK